jgi:hypothetical protein
MRLKIARRIYVFSICLMIGLALSLASTWGRTTDIGLRVVSLVFFGLSAFFSYVFRDIYYRCPLCKHVLGFEFERYCSHCGKEVPLEAKAGRASPDDEDQDLEE